VTVLIIFPACKSNTLFLPGNLVLISMHQAWVMRILDIAKAYGALRGVSRASNWSVGECRPSSMLLNDQRYAL
jgi:hypothetical protein